MDGFGDECELRKNIETRESRFSRESSPTARGRLDFYRGPPMEQQAPLISGEKTLDYSLVRSSWNFDATPPSTRPIVARSLTKGSIRRERSESLPLWWKFHFTPTFAIFSSFFFFFSRKISQLSLGEIWQLAGWFSRRCSSFFLWIIVERQSILIRFHGIVI